MNDPETAAVIEAAKLWKARRINRNPGRFHPDQYAAACDELDRAITALTTAEQTAATRLNLVTPTDHDVLDKEGDRAVGAAGPQASHSGGV